MTNPAPTTLPGLTKGQRGKIREVFADYLMGLYDEEDVRMLISETVASDDDDVIDRIFNHYAAR